MSPSLLYVRPSVLVCFTRYWQVYFLRSMAVLIQAGPGGGVDIPAVKAVLHAQGLERCFCLSVCESVCESVCARVRALFV